MTQATRLLKKGSPVLKQQCQRVIKEFPLASEHLDAIDTCKDELRNLTGFWKERGMSVAATQVGFPDTPLFIMCAKKHWYTRHQYKQFQTYVNPQILEFSEESQLLWEGCISNDEHLCLVERPKFVAAQWHNLKGQPVNVMLSGLVARIFQHEVDHLNGELMWEEVADPTRVPRRLEKMVEIGEVARDVEKFYNANREFLMEW